MSQRQPTPHNPSWSRSTTPTEGYREERLYARFPRQIGSVLVVGAGSVGSAIARQLADVGISPLYLVDHDILTEENLVRHELGASYLGRPKAKGLAEYLRHKIPLCDAQGVVADFTKLPENALALLLDHVDVVVGAADTERCQRAVNEACWRAETPGVFPSVHVDPNLSDGEMGEVLWTLPGRYTPCYECVFGERPLDVPQHEARHGGMALDYQPLVHVTVRVILDLLRSIHDPNSLERSVLDPERNVLFVHAFVPVSESVSRSLLFDEDWRLGATAIRPTLVNDCSVCGLPQALREQARRAEEIQLQANRWASGDNWFSHGPAARAALLHPARVRQPPALATRTRQSPDPATWMWALCGAVLGIVLAGLVAGGLYYVEQALEASQDGLSPLLAFLVALINLVLLGLAGFVAVVGVPAGAIMGWRLVWNHV